MRIVITSDGRRVTDICSETDARRAVHKLGVRSYADRIPGTLSTTWGTSSSQRSDIASG